MVIEIVTIFIIGVLSGAMTVLVAWAHKGE
jgi:hypothetical protein